MDPNKYSETTAVTFTVNMNLVAREIFNLLNISDDGLNSFLSVYHGITGRAQDIKGLLAHVYELNRDIYHIKFFENPSEEWPVNLAHEYQSAKKSHSLLDLEKSVETFPPSREAFVLGALKGLEKKENEYKYRLLKSCVKTVATNLRHEHTMEIKAGLQAVRGGI